MIAERQAIPCRAVRDCLEAPGPIIAAPAVEPHIAAFLDDLQPIPVEFRLVQPGKPAGGASVGTGLHGAMKRGTGARQVPQNWPPTGATLISARRLRRL